jgi:hypothetical protein
VKEKVKEQLDFSSMLEDLLPVKVEITFQFVKMKGKKYFAILLRGIEE